jgi:hypothetical protein
MPRFLMSSRSLSYLHCLPIALSYRKGIELSPPACIFLTPFLFVDGHGVDANENQVDSLHMSILAVRSLGEKSHLSVERGHSLTVTVNSSTMSCHTWQLCPLNHCIKY